MIIPTSYAVVFTQHRLNRNESGTFKRNLNIKI